MDSDNEKKGNREKEPRGLHRMELQIETKGMMYVSASEKGNAPMGLISGRQKDWNNVSASEKGNAPMGLISGKQKDCLMYESKSFEDYLYRRALETQTGTHSGQEELKQENKSEESVANGELSSIRNVADVFTKQLRIKKNEVTGGYVEVLI